MNLPKLFQPTFPKPLPVGAEIVQHDGEPHVRLKVAGRFVLYPVTKDGKRYLKPLAMWYARVNYGNGVVKNEKLSTNKQAAQLKLGDLIRDIQLGDAGAVDPLRKHRRTPLSEHLDAWAANLRAEDVTEKHVEDTTERVKKILKACRFEFAADFDAAAVQQYLAGRRKPKAYTLPDGQEWFQNKELNALLGLKGNAIAPTILRHRLPAVGSGKTRRYPRATAEALLAIRNRGDSVRTVNTYVASLKAFANWMVQAKRLKESPFEVLTIGNVDIDPRHKRRAFTVDEFDRLLAAALGSEKEVRGLTGYERAMLYLVAGSTGFRVGELAALTPSMFELDTATPTVTPPARKAKNRKLVQQPLPREVAEQVREFLRGVDPKAPAWPEGWAADAAEMLRTDLAAAGIPYVVDSPSGPLYGDLHAIRHSFIRWLDLTGATLTERMQLARHSDPRLTLAVYGQASQEELGAKVNQIKMRIHVEKHVEAGGNTGGLHGTSGDKEERKANREGERKHLENKSQDDIRGHQKTPEESTPGAARTHNRPLRRRLLYPVELRVQVDGHRPVSGARPMTE